MHQFSFLLFFKKLSLSQYHQFSRGVGDFYSENKFILER